VSSHISIFNPRTVSTTTSANTQSVRALSPTLTQSLTVLFSVRFMKAPEFKGKLAYFERSFSRHRRELQEILVIRNEIRTVDMNQGIEQLRINTERILARLGEPTSDEEIQALEIVRVCGKDRVLHVSLQLVYAVPSLIHEPEL
jgi:hypothetical protein